MKKHASILGPDGKSVEVELKTDIYQAAHDKGLSIPQYLNSQFETNPDKYGSAFTQLCASVGLFQRTDKEFGFRSPTVAQAISGSMRGFDAAGIVHDQVPASRILFPAVILEMIENKLQVDRQSAPAIFDQMIAVLP